MTSALAASASTSHLVLSAPSVHADLPLVITVAHASRILLQMRAVTGKEVPAVASPAHRSMRGRPLQVIECNDHGVYTAGLKPIAMPQQTEVSHGMQLQQRRNSPPWFSACMAAPAVPFGHAGFRPIPLQRAGVNAGSCAFAARHA